MSDEGRRRWWRDDRDGCARGCGCFTGCGTFVFVFLVGGLFSLFGAAFGIGGSLGVPGMQSNISASCAIGTKTKTIDALPGYTKERLAGNQNFINQSGTLTVGPAEGACVFIVGQQPGAPAIDLFLTFR